MPDQLPVIAVAASGPESVKIAAELGDGLFATDPDGDLVRNWHRLGGSGFACGPDVSRHLEVAQPFVDAGFDRLALMNAGPDPDGFLDFFTSELAEPLRKLTPAS